MMAYDAKPSKKICVWYSNQLEELTSRLIENLEGSTTSPTARLFEMPMPIVPNANITTYSKYVIASATGVTAGLNFAISHALKC